MKISEKPPEAPRPARIACPYCDADHIDVGEWETRPHHKHKCLACEKLFRFEGADGEYFYGVATKAPTIIDPKPYSHDPIFDGGPCRRCSLRYSPKTAYVACLYPGDTIEMWRARQPEDVLAMLR